MLVCFKLQTPRDGRHPQPMPGGSNWRCEDELIPTKALWVSLVLEPGNHIQPILNEVVFLRKSLVHSLGVLLDLALLLIRVPSLIHG